MKLSPEVIARVEELLDDPSLAPPRMENPDLLISTFHVAMLASAEAYREARELVIRAATWERECFFCKINNGHHLDRCPALPLIEASRRRPEAPDPRPKPKPTAPPGNLSLPRPGGGG